MEFRSNIKKSVKLIFEILVSSSDIEPRDSSCLPDQNILTRLHCYVFYKFTLPSVLFHIRLAGIFKFSLLFVSLCYLVSLALLNICYLSLLLNVIRYLSYYLFS